MKRARSPSLTSSPIPQLEGICTPSTPKTNLLSRPKDTEESDPKSEPEPEPDPESVPEPEPETESMPEPDPDPESAPEPEPETESVPELETEASPEYETELEIELKPPVNIANTIFTFCEEQECTVCPVRHNAIKAYEKVEKQIKYHLVNSYRMICCFSAMDVEGVSYQIFHWHSKSNLCLSYESFM